MDDSLIRIEAVFGSHYYCLTFAPSRYTDACKQIAQWRKDGCPLTLIQTGRLMTTAFIELQKYKRRLREAV